jgi:ribosomal protein S18 acetylase RimI-like enzyme
VANGIIIRTMQEQDIKGVTRLMLQLDGEIDSGHCLSPAVINATFAAMREDPRRYRNYVAENDGGVIGFISSVVYKTFFHPGGTALINELIVGREYRGRGIGQKLIQKILTMAREEKLNEVEVSTWFENKKAIAFYRKRGFTDESLLLGIELSK